MKHKDKIKHFLVSFILAALIYWLSRNYWVAIFGTLLFGVAKEIYDQSKGKNTTKESIADMMVNVLGITAGILFSQYLL